MKNQWPLWVFMIGVVVIVLFAFNYQGGKDVVPLSEIFPEEDFEDVPNIEYEFVDEDGQAVPAVAQRTPAAAETESAAAKARRVMAQAESAPARTTEAKEPEAEASAQAGDISRTPFTIQVASYSRREAAELRLKKIKAAGHPAYIVRTDLGPKGVWYRIYIGSFDTKGEANAYLSQVKDDYKDSFIISPKKQ